MCQSTFHVDRSAMEKRIRILEAENKALHRDLARARYYQTLAQSYEQRAAAADAVLRTLADALVPFLPQPALDYDE
jgi:hypothetical protein